MSSSAQLLMQALHMVNRWHITTTRARTQQAMADCTCAGWMQMHGQAVDFRLPLDYGEAGAFGGPPEALLPAGQDATASGLPPAGMLQMLQSKHRYNSAELAGTEYVATKHMVVHCPVLLVMDSFSCF